MNILAIIGAIKEVLGLVKAVYDVSKIVASFYENPDDVNRQRYESVMEEIIRSRSQLLGASASILGAIAQLDQTIFRGLIADKLGDVDQAELALDTFRRTGDAGQRVAALDSSAGALADILEFDSNRVYPVESIVLHVSQILLRRMIILREADPGFCTSVGSTPINQGISIIRSAASQIEAAISSTNTIREQRGTKRKIRIIPPSEGGGRETIVTWTFSIRYSNVSGTAAYSGSTSTEDGPEEPEFLQAIQQLRNEANAARQRGLADDTANAAIVEMRGIADQAELALRSCESKHFGLLVFGRELNFIERAKYADIRRENNPRLSFLRLVESSSTRSERSLDRTANVIKIAGELMKRPLSAEEESALKALGKAFGPNQVAITILNHPDCAV